jgi:asparagine synthase (glutamine-hydrolysing)
MHHFLGFVWNAADLAASSAARRLMDDAKRGNAEWQEAFSDGGLAVFERPPFAGSTNAQPLPNNAGVILGRVFPRNLEHWATGWTWRVTEHMADAIIASQGRSMLAQIWGGYVAFLYDTARRSVYVIRDCSGKIPCYRTQHFGVEIIFADLADLRDLRLPTFGINLKYVTAFACASQLQIRATGLNEVTELLAGDCFGMTEGMGSQYAFWSPVRIFDDDRIDSFEVAAAEVRFTTERCIAAWASAFERISLSLSGGLDSAVVLGCLRKTKPADALRGINRYGVNVVEDERHYARIAATAAGVALSEFPFLHQAWIDERLYRFPLVAKPNIPGIFGNLDVELSNDLMRQQGADSIWTGQGGDHLFFQARIPVGARDYLELNGVNRGLLHAIMNARKVSRQPYWTTLRTLASPKMSLTVGMTAFRRAKSPFLTEDAQSAISNEYLAHPWMTDAAHLPPGRRFQVAALSEVLNRHRHFPGLERVHGHHPLLCQPLIELCLRIPSYVHLRDGVTRAVERAAFRDVVPAEILARGQKGQSTMSLLDCLHRSGNFVRELLMDGILAQEKILDCLSIEPYLKHKRPMEVSHLFPLTACIVAELWARSWAMARRQ